MLASSCGLKNGFIVEPKYSMIHQGSNFDFIYVTTPLYEPQLPTILWPVFPVFRRVPILHQGEIEVPTYNISLLSTTTVEKRFAVLSPLSGH